MSTTEGGCRPNKKRSAVSRRAMYLKFEHIVFYVFMQTGGVCPQRPATTQDAVQIPAAQSALFYIK